MILETDRRVMLGVTVVIALEVLKLCIPTLGVGTEWRKTVIFIRDALLEKPVCNCGWAVGCAAVIEGGSRPVRKL